MRMLMGGSKRHIDDTRTLIVVDVDRLKEEYERGVRDQLFDEHWRKQLRIAIGLGASGVGLLATIFGVNSAPFIALFINCLVHVLL